MNAPEALLVATHNAGKIREYRALLADLPLKVTWLEAEGITVDVEEDADTFSGNAVRKALAYAAISGMWTWADDSGLSVDALGGAPGVHSARYGGPGMNDADRRHLVLEKLRAIPRDRWMAAFHCVVALATPDGRVYQAMGRLDGMITDQPRGANGFGYDPIFLLPERGRTLAELEPEEKNRISHRALAAAAARDLLTELLAELPAELPADGAPRSTPLP